MDKAPKPSEVPAELLEVIYKPENWQWLCEQWDRKYPDNPVEGSED